MARKSRKAEISNIQRLDIKTSGKHQLMTAAYARLSREKETDDSIQTQMEILHQYIMTNPELVLYGEYVDNGITGTRFNRPGFNRLMEDVRRGKIQCIVVKDLSRFGRDYLEVGYYLDVLLPRLGVRFISVSDCFDSENRTDGDAMSVPLKNIINGMYARDISKKMCAANEARRNNGTGKISGTPPYGYGHDDDQLVLDPETSPYIRMIFQWTRIGRTSSEIAERLNYIDAPVPSLLRNHGDQSECTWNAGSLRAILMNPNYTGDLYLGRFRQALYKDKRRYIADRDDWVIFENDHDPLVSKKDFELIHRMFSESEIYSSRFLEYNVQQQAVITDQLKGLVYCAECGRRMHFERISEDYSLPSEEDITAGLRGKKSGKKTIGLYRCPPQSGRAKCGGQKIYQGFLNIFVMDQIRFVVTKILDQARVLNSTVSIEGKNPILSLKKKVVAAGAKAADCKEKIAKLYESYSEGVVSKEEFDEIKTVLSGQYKECIERQADLSEQLSKKETLLYQYTKLADDVKNENYGMPFDEKIVKKLIYRINVSRTGRIEVVFRFKDILEDLFMNAEGSGEE